MSQSVGCEICENVEYKQNTHKHVWTFVHKIITDH